MEIKGIKKSKKGFTLIESIVVMGVFVIVIVSVVDIYLLYSKTHSVTQKRQNVLNKVSFSLEKIAQDIRTNEIVFSDQNFSSVPNMSEYYGSTYPGSALYGLDGTDGIGTKEMEIAVIDPTDTSGSGIIIYAWDDTGSKICDDYSESGIYRYDNSTERCEIMFDDVNLTIIDAGFYITPSVNPYPDSTYDCKNGIHDGYMCTCSIDADCWSGDCTDNYCDPVDQQPMVTIVMTIEDGSEHSVQLFDLQTVVSSRIYKR